MTEARHDMTEARQCIQDDPHPAHPWRSISHAWECPGRSIPRAARLSGKPDLQIGDTPDPLWMRVVARLSTADWWAIGTAAVVGCVGGVLVGLWYR